MHMYCRLLTVIKEKKKRKGFQILEALTMKSKMFKTKNFLQCRDCGFKCIQLMVQLKKNEESCMPLAQVAIDDLKWNVHFG